MAFSFTYITNPMKQSVQLDEDQVAALVSGLYYFSIDSEEFPDGDIGGAITSGASKQPVHDATESDATLDLKNWKMWVTLVVIVGMLLGLFFELYKSYFIVLLAMIVLMSLGIITLKDAVSGFSNEGMITIAALFIVVQPLSASGILIRLSKYVFGKSKNLRITMLRMMLPIIVLSVFLNNTPIVSLMIPVIKDWCRDHGVAPSKFLIPLSYSAIVGGICSLIGTSTNLVVNGFLSGVGEKDFSFFELGYLGIPCAVAFVIYMVAIGIKMLPDNKGGMFRLAREHGREFLSELRVVKKSPLVGKRAKDAISRLGLTDLTLVEIIREIKDNDEAAGEVILEHIVPVPDSEIIQEGDLLVFAGNIEQVMQLHSLSGIVDVVDLNFPDILGTVEPSDSTELKEIAIDDATGSSDANNNNNNNNEESVTLAPDSHDLLPFPFPAQSSRNRSSSNVSDANVSRSRRGSRARSGSAPAVPEFALQRYREYLNQPQQHKKEESITIATNNNDNVEEKGSTIICSSSTLEVETMPPTVPRFSTESYAKLQKGEQEIEVEEEKPAIVVVPELEQAPEFFEVVISSSNPVVGSTVSECKFSSRYGAVVLAIRRNGQSLQSELGKVVLRTGDTLLILAKAEFYTKFRNSTDFFVISRCSVDPSPPKNPNIVSIRGRKINMWWWIYGCFPIFIAMIIAAALGVPMLKCALMAAAAVVLLKYVSPIDAINSIEWQVLVLVGASFAVGIAIKESGLALSFAGLLKVVRVPSFVLPGLVFAITQLLTCVITNNAAAAIIFPLAVSVAQTQGLSIRPFAVAVAIAASSDFSTPIGYQTNLMVQGPGGYQFKDYVKVGLPLNFIFLAIASVLIPLIWKL